jgi:hypothetical protein
MKSLGLQFHVRVKNRMADVEIEMNAMVFRFNGPLSVPGPGTEFSVVPDAYDGTLVYFPSTKVLNFELTASSIDADGGYHTVDTISGALVPDAANLAKIVRERLSEEFPLIGPAIYQSLRRYFNE